MARYVRELGEGRMPPWVVVLASKRGAPPASATLIASMNVLSTTRPGPLGQCSQRVRKHRVEAVGGIPPFAVAIPEDGHAG